MPHHLTEAKLAGQVPGPVKANDQLPRGNPAARFNAWFAVKITSGVGTMWCAYAFAALALALALALVSLPSAISSHKPVVLCPGYPRRSSSWCSCRSSSSARTCSQPLRTSGPRPPTTSSAVPAVTGG